METPGQLSVEINTYGPLPNGESFDAAVARRHDLWTRVLAEEGAAYVVLDANRIVGFSHAVGNRLTTLYLLAAYQGRGIGHYLLLLVLGESAARGCSVLHFNVRTDNVNAIRFYESHGARRREMAVSESPNGAWNEFSYEIATARP